MEKCAIFYTEYKFYWDVGIIFIEWNFDYKSLANAVNEDNCGHNLSEILLVELRAMTAAFYVWRNSFLI